MEENEIIYIMGETENPYITRWQLLLLRLNTIPYLRRLAQKPIKRIFALPDSCDIGMGFYCNHSTPHFLKIGKNVSLNDTFIVAWAPITIGEGTSFSFKNKIITSTHDYENWGKVIGKPVIIGKYCWITTDVTILPCVTIGDHTVIGAGSVVTRDIPSGVFAAGNPCRVIKKIKFRE